MASRPRVGLVLGGGGARGFAHIGVLKVLEQLRIPVDYVAGTSMGALVGGAYASGMPVEEMENLVNNIDWKDIFDDNPPRRYQDNRLKEEDRLSQYSFTVGVDRSGLKLPKGLISGQKLDQFLQQLADRAEGIDDFDQLPVPYRAVATRLVDGEIKVFGHGNLFTAMRASMSIPGLLSPVEVNGVLLVDGGLVRNLPVDIVREMGADVVIAINVGTPPFKEDELTSALAVTVQMLNVVLERNVTASIRSLGPDDILIKPDLGDITSTGFNRSAEAIGKGVDAASGAADRLSRLSLSEAEFQRWRKQRLRPPVEGIRVTVDEIRIEGTERVNPEIVRRRALTRPGDTVEREQVQRDVARIYGLGDFERVDSLLVDENGRQVLIFDAIEKSWGPNFLRFGLNIFTDFKGDNSVSLAGIFKMTQLNRYGAEWRTAAVLGTQNLGLRTEFYQPFTPGGALFINPLASIEDNKVNIFQERQQIAEYSVERARIGLELGWDFDDWGQARIGLGYGSIEADRDIGSRVLPEFDDNEGFFTGRFSLDQLDSLNFPKQGYLFRTEAFLLREALGSDNQYTRLSGRALLPWTWGRHTLLGGLEFGASPGGDLPLYDRFTLGGLFRLSGLRRDQIRGDYLGYGSLIYYYKIAELNPTLGTALYAGGSLEAGNVWEDRDDVSFNRLITSGSLFLGLDSLIGPLYLGYGQAEGGESTVYFLLGRPFF